MSLLKANAVQLGQSLTPTNNFVWYQPTNPDGSIHLANGVLGNFTDIITITNNGNLSLVGSVKFYEDDTYGNNYVGFKAPIAVNNNVIWSLPSTDGVNGQGLRTDGNGNLSWGGVGGTISDDTTTDASYYPSLVTATSGIGSNIKVSSTKFYFNPSTGTLNATTFNSLSDANQKTNVTKIENATETLSKIDSFEFDWIDNGKHSAGVIAQKLEEILPFLVETNEDGVKSVNYSGLIAYLIKANTELAERISTLENK